MFAASKTAAVSGGYQISRSLRFSSADASNLSRTPASAGNRTTWTFSIWFKRSAIAVNYEGIFSAGNGTDQIRFENTDTLKFLLNGATSGDFTTTQVFRDPSAWCHLVVAVDTTQATSTNRVKIYFNGSQITAFGTATYPSQNYQTTFNSATDHRIGVASTSSYYFNGYQTETNFIDGQALTPSSFGETNAQTGVWQPKAYSGSYGTNGFYLNFSDNSNTTAATLGKDYSGNGNNWTPNNFSVTAGVGNDSLVDVPTPYGVDTGVGGEVRGNYCTFNPVLYNAGSVGYTNGNLLMTMTAGADRFNLGTIGALTGKYYWEFTLANINSSGDVAVGICKVTRGANGPWVANGGPETIYFNTGNGWNVYGTNVGGGTGTISNDVLGIALDMDGNNLYIYKNNVLLASRSGSIDLTVAHTLFIDTYATNSNASLNAGQRPFLYTAPSGYKALCTQNLPTPTIGATTATQAGKYFNAVTYTGTGSSLGVTGVGFQPDWVWAKGRSGATDHGFYDAVRGVQKQLESNTNTAETTETTGITAFGSDGFTTGALAQLNTSAATYVAWNWKANGSGSTNTSGSITSTVSASTTSGFSIVAYTGTGANATVGHGLGVAPSLIFGRSRTTAGGWPVYSAFVSNPTNSYLVLNTTDAVGTASNYWGTSAPTSTTFSLSTYDGNNKSGDAFVMYCFAPIAGYSAFGSYTGNGSTDGPFVYTNMRPAYVMVKRTDANGDWRVWDVARETYNVMSAPLYPNDSGAEASSSVNNFDVLSNGFKVRNATAAINANGGAYIYMAFASSPFKFSLGR
jgi:hypothetical protein